jgi:hypothetical protein
VLFALGIQALNIAFIDSSSLQVYSSSPLLSPWLNSFHQSTNGFYISIAITFILSLSVGFAYNFIINANEVLFRQSVFPVFFFFYLNHLYGVQNLLNPQLLASVFCMLLVYKYLSLDPRNIKTTPFLDMGFFAAMAFCILPETIWFVPALLIALIVAGYLTFRNFLLLLTGMSIPIYFLGVGYYLADGDWSNYLQFFNFNVFSFSVERFTTLSSIDYMILGYIVFVLLIGLLTLQPNFSKNTIRTRRSQQLLLLFLVSGIAAIIFSPTPLNQSLTLLSLPVSIFLSYYFLKTKRAFWKESLFALFFIILIIAKIATIN